MSTPAQVNQRGPQRPPTLIVETFSVTTQNYPIVLSSFGKIYPSSKTQLSAQVSGKIIALSQHFKTGSFFSKGDVLVRIDPRDYEIKVQSASAERAKAQVAFDEEKALSAQALKDRQGFDALNKVTDYALRKPQMAAAKAKLDAADANLKQALLDVERTKIRAPYDGRILAKNVAIGELVGSSSNLAEIYAIDSVQVELPINSAVQHLIELPNNTFNTPDNPVTVTVYSDQPPTDKSWTTDLTRTSAAIDATTLQLSIIAEIKNNHLNPSQGSLHIGQFVHAQIQGKVIDNAIVIPNAAIYQGNYVYIYDNGVLHRREISISYQNNTESLIDSGLKIGQQLVLTPLGQINSGTAASLLGQPKNLRRGPVINRRSESSSQLRGTKRRPDNAQSPPWRDKPYRPAQRPTTHQSPQEPQ